MLCPSGTERVEGRGCVSKQQANLGSSNLAPSYQQTKRYDPGSDQSSVFTHIPSWSYISLSLAVISHTLNFFSSNPVMINSSFITAITGYALTAGGVGYGVYKSFDAVPSPSGAERFALEQGRLYDQGERAVRFNLSFEF